MVERLSKVPTDIGCIHLVEHEIHLEIDDQFKDHYKNNPLVLILKVREHLNEMIKAGAIRPFKCTFSYNVVIAQKMAQFVS